MHKLIKLHTRILQFKLNVNILRTGPLTLASSRHIICGLHKYTHIQYDMLCENIYLHVILHKVI